MCNITKHTRFWLCINNPNNPLPMYDSTFANRLMGRACVYLRIFKLAQACKAIDEMRQQSEENGNSEMTLDEINAEILAARHARKEKVQQ